MKCLGIIVFLTIVSNTSLADQYLCIAEESTGFFFNEKSNKWETSKFQTDHLKYVVSQVGPEEVYSFVPRKWSYKVVKHGENWPSFLCEEDFNKPGYLSCPNSEASNNQGDFHFNNKNLRFLIANPFGYFNVLPSINKITDETSATPFMTIGKCSRF